MLIDHARRLRRDSTDAEKALWRILRARQLAGFKFRRQQPLGACIVDFVCFAHRLVIEADGGQHADSPTDAIRDAWLADNGFRVLRFWNNDILSNPEGVTLAILDALKSPSPPAGEGLGRGGSPDHGADGPLTLPATRGPSLSREGRGR